MNVLQSVQCRAEKARVAIAERDLAIRAACRAGCTLRETAKAAGLSHTGIAKIAQRWKESNE